MSVDGRRLRSERTRAAVVEATLALTSGAEGVPTSSEIAARAGVTQRTLFRHFETMDDVFAELIAHQAEVFSEHLESIDTTGTTEERIQHVVANRCELFSTIAPVRQAAIRISRHQPLVAEGLGAASRALRSQATSLFATELEALPRSQQAPAREAIDLALSWEIWERLHTTQRLSDEMVVATMTRLLQAALRPA